MPNVLKVTRLCNRYGDCHCHYHDHSIAFNLGDCRPGVGLLRSGGISGACGVSGMCAILRRLTSLLVIERPESGCVFLVQLMVVSCP